LIFNDIINFSDYVEIKTSINTFFNIVSMVQNDLKLPHVFNFKTELEGKTGKPKIVRE